MLRIGLTGGIGSGKSTVAKIFSVLGIPVYYADEAAKKLMNDDEQLKHSIIREFGEEAYSNNMLNRKYLAAEVFQNKDKLEVLNALVHPATMRDGEKWMKDQTAAYAIKEAALIFESGSDATLDYVIGVSAPLDLRIERSLSRDGATKEEIQRRIWSQMDEEEKMQRCDFIIVNDEQQAVLPQVLEIHQRLLHLAEQN